MHPRACETWMASRHRSRGGPTIRCCTPAKKKEEGYVESVFWFIVYTVGVIVWSAAAVEVLTMGDWF